MKNNFKLTLFTLLIVFTLCSNTYCQIFHINEKDNPEISLENFMNARINGVRLKNIRYPDVNFDVLKPLGKPRAKDHIIHEGVGERITFKYIGFDIHYGALSQPEFVLKQIEFHGSGSVGLKIDNENTLRTGNPIESYIKNVANAGVNFADREKITVDVPGDDGVRIRIDLEDGIIKKMVLRFIKR